MKVNKHFLSKIIKEEIKNVLYEDSNALNRIAQMRTVAAGDPNDELASGLVKLFIKYRDYLTKNPTKNKEVYNNIESELKSIAPNMSSVDILQMLDGKIDRQLFTFIVNLFKRDKRLSNFSDKLDDYEMSMSPEEQNVYQVYNREDPDPAFMRVPKDDNAYDQEDLRKDRKTLTKA